MFVPVPSLRHRKRRLLAPRQFMKSIMLRLVRGFPQFLLPATSKPQVDFSITIRISRVCDGISPGFFKIFFEPKKNFFDPIFSKCLNSLVIM